MEDTSKILITYLGLAGSGKSYQSNILEESGFKRLSFADELRRMTLDLLGVEDFQDYNEFKRTVIINYHNIKMTGRDILQRLGTNVIRTRYNNHFLDALKIKIEKYNKVGVDDCRFLNEVELLNSLKEADYSVQFRLCDRYNNIPELDNIHVSEHLAAHLTSYFGKSSQYWKRENIDNNYVELNYNLIRLLHDIKDIGK